MNHGSLIDDCNELTKRKINNMVAQAELDHPGKMLKREGRFGDETVSSEPEAEVQDKDEAPKMSKREARKRFFANF